MFYHLYPESYTPFSSQHFSLIKRYKGISHKASLSTDSVTKKITVICAVYFYNSGSIFTAKNFGTESVLKVRSFMRDILASLERGKMWAGKMVYNFLGNDEKTGRNLYFRLKRCGKEVWHFPVQYIKTKTM